MIQRLLTIYFVSAFLLGVARALLFIFFAMGEWATLCVSAFAAIVLLAISHHPKLENIAMWKLFPIGIVFYIVGQLSAGVLSGVAAGGGGPIALTIASGVLVLGGWAIDKLSKMTVFKQYISHDG